MGLQLASPEPRAPASPYPCCPGWVGPAPRSGGDIAVCPPNRRHSGATPSPTSFPPKLSGSPRGTHLPVPACQAQLHARPEIPAVDEAATSWSPVCARRPAGRARILSLNTDSLRKCADFCPFAKWGNQGAERGKWLPQEARQEAVARGLPPPRDQLMEPLLPVATLCGFSAQFLPFSQTREA